MPGAQWARAASSRAVWSAWKWTSLILARSRGRHHRGARDLRGWVRRHTAQDTEMAAARAKAISIVRTRARNACDVSPSHKVIWTSSVQGGEGNRPSRLKRLWLRSNRMPSGSCVRARASGSSVRTKAFGSSVRTTASGSSASTYQVTLRPTTRVGSSIRTRSSRKTLLPEGWTVSGIGTEGVRQPRLAPSLLCLPTSSAGPPA